VEPRTKAVVSLDDVRGYSVTKPGRGAYEGMTWGFLGGAALGVLAGLTSGNSGGCPGSQVCLAFSPGPGAAALLGVTFGAAGALYGALVGAIVGHTDHYTF
jgi:hypothetical protein